MILIADSGSTKTEWVLLHRAEVQARVITKGINPFFQTEDEIVEEMMNVLVPNLGSSVPTSVYFYGAGCAFPEKKEMVAKAIKKSIAVEDVCVESDLLAAARALFQNTRGIACILGTGSNSCYYDGNEIVKNVSPLGFILGDEGSGAVLGKLFVSDCLKNQLPTDISENFFKKYNQTPAQILESVYKKPFPNRYLAGFAPFLAENIEEPTIFNIVFDSFYSFFVRNVMQYDLEGLEVGFVGSIASHFKDTLEIVASECGITLNQILQSPMDGLIKYHEKFSC